MKQHITPKQCKEVTLEQLTKLLGDDLVQREDYANFHHKKITIGKLLEFLESKVGESIAIHKEYDDEYGKSYTVYGYDESPYPIFHYSGDIICDALWEAVKEGLDD